MLALPAIAQEIALYVKPLYVVGGYVRNRIMGIGGGDVDIASFYTPADIEKMLDGKGFGLNTVNRRLGTVKISKNGASAEYTSFRKDSYSCDGSHKPVSVTFTDSLAEDALRRDFTVNAVYCDAAGNITDPVEGTKDIEKGLLRTVRSPDEVFREDALRLMRLVRFAAELGFEAEPLTMESAVKNAHLIQNVAPERIRQELDLILVADTRYPELHNVDGHERGIRLLKETGLLKYVLPPLWECVGYKQDSVLGDGDVFEHSVRTFALSPAEIRLAALLHGIGKPLSAKNPDGKELYSEAGARAADALMGENGLRYSAQKREETVFLIKNHTYDTDGKTDYDEVKIFTADNMRYAGALISLKNAVGKAGGFPQRKGEAAGKIAKAYAEIIKNNLPVNEKQLLIDGNDAIKAGFSGQEIKNILKDTVACVLTGKVANNRDAQLKHLGERSKKND